MIADETLIEETTDVTSTQVEVPAEPTKQVQKTIQNKLGVTLKNIEKMQSHAETLAIANHDDKAGFNAVYGFRQTVKDQRVLLEKTAKALKDPHTAYNRQVDQLLKALTEPMKQIESKLSVMEKGYNDERDRQKREKELAQQRRIETRAKAMRSFGFEYDEVRDAYVFINQRTGEEVTIPFEDIREKSDDDFVASHDLAKTTFDDEQAELADIKRKEEAEAQRIKDEQAAAQKVIDDQREQLAAQQREFDRKQAEFAEQQRQAKEQQDNASWALRLPQLLDAGFVTGKDINSCTNGTVRWTKSQIVALNESDFTQLVADLREQAFEKERQRVADEKTAKQAEADKKKADLERQKRLAPEKERSKTYLAKLWAMPIPTMTEPETTDVLEAFGSELEKLINHYEKQIDQL